MRRAISAILGIMSCLAAAVNSRADSTWEFSVQASATVQATPAQIVLNWPQDSYLIPNSYTVYRKATSASTWGSGTTLPGTATSYADSSVTVGTAYEYQVIKVTSQYTGYGYVYAGINVPLVESRGKLLLVVDNTYAANLTNELAQLQQDLLGDGWSVIRIDINRTDSPVTVKNLIKAQYIADPANVKSVFLFGHVPVAYSGDIVPDGHMPDHQGAWPCDGFYGDMDGAWTDSSVNDTSATEARNRNTPGDGKYDQSTFPAPIKLMVGRVDLANMPGRLTWGGPATFPSELELLRNYLNKDHKYRQKQYDLPRRAVVGDYFGYRNGEAFAASGWRNFAAFFGAANVSNLPTQGTWVPTLNTNACLFAYGCGSGSYTSIGGLGNTDIYHDGITTELMSNDVRAVFTLLFGSWLGDWDSEDNIMRSILALPSYGLASVWSGRPHWFMHHMALGETIGYSARLTQNNAPGGLYLNQINSCAGQIHIALMGDPTLRMHIVAPPTNLQLSTNGGGTTLSWVGSSDSVLGYHVYRASTATGPFTRLTSTLATANTFTDASTASGSTYMVRAVKLETSGSGTYYNPSQGIFISSGNGNQGIVVNPTNSVPSVSIVSPTPNTTLSGTTVMLSATASDSAGIASVQFQLDGISIGTELTSSPYNLNWNPTGVASGNHTLTATGRSVSGNVGSSAAIPITVSTGASASTNVSWIDDALPTGAIGTGDGGDGWNWITSNPAPQSGAVANQSSASAGLHQHYFVSASQSLSIQPGDRLYAYVYIDPANVPSELMLQWFDGTWEHRAFWGANMITYGANGTASRLPMGAMPPAGQWVRLEVPANQVGLESSVITGMSFTLYDGRATWDNAGKTSQAPSNSGAPVVTIIATSKSASRLNATPAVVTLTRTGDTSEALAVNYGLTGTATNTVDYSVTQTGQSQPLANSVIFTPGAATVSLNVVPNQASDIIGDLSVVLTLESGTAYQLGNPATAAVILGGNTIPLSLTLSSNVPQLRWSSVPNRTYRIASKNSLSDPSWTTRAQVTANSTISAWVDEPVTAAPQRFYLVAQVN
jgi:hypothetical protein